MFSYLEIILISDEGGEEDSFVGQGPTQSSLFQPTSSASDPFAQVGHNPLPPAPVSSSAPLFSRPPASNTPPMPRDGSPNPVKGTLQIAISILVHDLSLEKNTKLCEVYF